MEHRPDIASPIEPVATKSDLATITTIAVQLSSYKVGRKKVLVVRDIQPSVKLHMMFELYFFHVPRKESGSLSMLYFSVE